MAEMTKESATGVFLVGVGDKTTEIEADRWDYNQRDELQFWKGGQVIAVFRWWESIKAKGA